MSQVRYTTYKPSGAGELPVSVEEATRLFAEQLSAEKLKTNLALVAVVGLAGALAYRTWRCRQDVAYAETEALRSLVRSGSRGSRRYYDE